MHDSDSESPQSGHGRSSTSTKDGGHQQQPKRGAKACTTCRKGKNRCVNDNGVPPCKRCAAGGLNCVFEQTQSKDEERLERLERSVGGLTSTIEGLLGVIRNGGMPGMPTATPSTSSYDPFAHNGNNGAVNYQSLANPPIMQGTPQPSANLRLDADFNARSPSNPVHWEIDSMVNGNLTQLLSSSRGYMGHHQGVLQPPVIPGMGANGGGVGGIPVLSFASASPVDQSPDAFGGSGSGSVVGAVASGKKRIRDGMDDGGDGGVRSSAKSFPPLPNYRAPPHPISQYGLAPSNVPSDDEDAIPTSSLTAPFEALAEAAAAAASGTATPVSKGRPKKRRKRMPPPPNAFPDVIEKGLVSDAIARQIFSFYIIHCHKFFPILDPSTIDTYEGMRFRTPWSIDSILAAAASRMPSPSQEIQAAAEQASEEAQGISRSSLFGPTVRKEGVQAMALVACWSDNGYCAAGHALRMGLELGLHRALAKLMESATIVGEGGKLRQEDEEQDLVVSSRIFLCLLWLDYVVSCGSGRPHLYDDELVSSDKLATFLRHPLSTQSDVLLVALIELMACRTRVERGFGITTDARLADFVRRSARDLQTWWKKWDAKLAVVFEDETFERKSLMSYYHAASVMLATTALKGVVLTDVEKLSVDARELAMTARQSTHDMLELWLTTPALQGSLRYATQSTFIDISFSALLLLKLSRLFPEGAGPFTQVVSQCHQLQTILRDIPRADRYYMTLRIALERFCKAANVELPEQPAPDLSSDMLSADFGVGSSNFEYPSLDVSSLPVFTDPSWVGSETVPDWLSNPLSWTFDSLDMSQGLDKVFLPAWSVDSFNYGEW